MISGWFSLGEWFTSYHWNNGGYQIYEVNQPRAGVESPGWGETRENR